VDEVGLALVLATLRLATPLALASLGELIAERSGVLNIGIEGMMLAGAFAAFASGAATGSVAIGCGAALLAGAALAALFGLFVLGRGADPIVCGTGLNLLALGLTGSLHRTLFPPGVDPGTAPQMPDLLPGANGFLLLAVGIALAAVLLLTRTRVGLVLRAVGERAEAAHAHGIAVLRVRWGATLIGGACAGLAGAALVLWVSDTFVEGMTSGRGFIALALVLFGGYRVPAAHDTLRAHAAGAGAVRGPRAAPGRSGPALRDRSLTCRSGRRQSPKTRSSTSVAAST
jgi:simple sugar transport system permease protein